MNNTLRRLSASQQFGLLGIVIVLLVISESINPVTLHLDNLVEILHATAIYFIAACGATLVLVGGGLDLSVGSVFAVGGVAAGFLMVVHVPWPLAIIAAVAISCLFGLVNAFLIIKLKIPPFITTLGTYFAATGIVIVSTGGNPISGFPAGFNNMGQLRLFSVPFLVFYAVIIGVVFHLLLQKTRYGYDAKAVGGNETAALANGVQVVRVKTVLYVVSAGIAGLSGILLASRLSTADPGSGGSGFTFQVLAAVIIGGTSLFGGIGTISGTAIGALLFSVINNALALTNVNPQWQNIATGGILVLAVAVDQLRRGRQFRSKTT